MQIDYQITFRADGVTVTQKIQPDWAYSPGIPAATPVSPPLIPQSPAEIESGFALPGQLPTLKLPGGGPDSEFTSGTDDKTGTGGGGTAPGVVLCCPVVIAYGSATNDRRRPQ